MGRKRRLKAAVMVSHSIFGRFSRYVNKLKRIGYRPCGEYFYAGNEYHIIMTKI